MIKETTVRRNRLFRLFERALRKGVAHTTIRRELMALGVTRGELYAFQLRINKIIKEERS